MVSRPATFPCRSAARATDSSASASATPTSPPVTRPTVALLEISIHWGPVRFPFVRYQSPISAFGPFPFGKDLHQPSDDLRDRAEVGDEELHLTRARFFVGCAQDR